MAVVITCALQRLVADNLQRSLALAVAPQELRRPGFRRADPLPSDRRGAKLCAAASVAVGAATL